MTFTFRVYYDESSRYDFGKVKYRLVRAKTKLKAIERFFEKYGIKPLRAE